MGDEKKQNIIKRIFNFWFIVFYLSLPSWVLVLGCTPLHGGSPEFLQTLLILYVLCFVRVLCGHIKGEDDSVAAFYLAAIFLTPFLLLLGGNLFISLRKSYF